MGLVVDVAFEDLYGRTAEPDVLEAAVRGAIEANSQFAAFCNDLYIVVADLVVPGRQGAGGDAGAAGEGFVFDTAFIGADDDLVGSDLFHEVDVDAFLYEVAAIADIHAFMGHVEFHDVGDHCDIMRGAGIEEEVATEVVDIPDVLHFEADDTVDVDLGEVGAVGGNETVFGFSHSEIISEFDQAAAAVAAHGAFAAVGIIIFHFEVVTRVGVEEHESVGADAKAAIAKEPDAFGCQGGVRPVAVVQDDKIVAGALVFIEVHLVHSWGEDRHFVG